MVSLGRVFCFLVYSIIFFTGHVSTFPANGPVVLPVEVAKALEGRGPPVNEVQQRDVNATIEERNLFSCFASLCCLKSRGSSNTATCPWGWPTIDDLRAKIRDHGNVGRQVSLFYTGLGGSGALRKTGEWAQCHTQYIPANPGYVNWNGITDRQWFEDTAIAIAKQFTNIKDSVKAVDPFMKLLAQAFAAESAGDVYLFTPAGQDPDDPGPGAGETTAWAGWEFPALTRNPNVRTIYRVDPDSQTDTDRHVLWKQGDGATPNAPLGLNNAPNPPG